MNGYVSRIIGVVLCFAMILVVYLYGYSVTEMQERREILNETQLFLDEVTDKRSITEDDITNLNLTLASHGMVLENTVSRKIRTAIRTPEGEVRTSYMVADDLSVLNQQDVVEVKIKEVTVSKYRQFLLSFLRIDEGPYTLTSSQTVR